MATTRVHFRDGIADVAHRFGVSVKALRVYEEMGLLVPVRDAKGWRTYGHSECERLHLILLLRQLGLSLTRIGDIVSSGPHALDDALAMQEKALEESADRVRVALHLVRRARARIAAGERIDVATLARLAREGGTGEFAWTPEFQHFLKQVVPEKSRERLAANAAAPDFAEQASQWNEIYAELARLTASSEPDSPEALAIAGRATALIRRVTGGDPDHWRALHDFWDKGSADPKLAHQLPLTREQWLFFERAMRALFAFGEVR